MGHKCSRDILYIQRAYVCYFYYHPLIGIWSVSLCCEIYDTNIKKLKGWLYKYQMIMKWLPLVKGLVVSYIITIIPVSNRKKIELAISFNRRSNWEKYLRLNWLMSLGAGIWNKVPWRWNWYFKQWRGTCPCRSDKVWWQDSKNIATLNTTCPVSY